MEVSTRHTIETEMEAAFVRTLAAIYTTQVVDLGQPLITTTDDRIRRVFEGLHPGLKLAPQEIERMKLKYVTRTYGAAGDKPARRRELLQQHLRGRRRSAGRSGVASLYIPTGLAELFAAAEVG